MKIPCWSWIYTNGRISSPAAQGMSTLAFSSPSKKSSSCDMQQQRGGLDADGVLSSGNEENSDLGAIESGANSYTKMLSMRKNRKDPILEFDAELAESIEFELGLKKQNGPRKNSWGNLSYAELITRALESSCDQRLTLSQIYDWIVRYVPYFKEKFDRTSSAGWKVSLIIFHLQNSGHIN